jgi:flagellar basal-body rod protein FlgF
MDNALMVGLSAQQVLRQRMDLTANNLANMTTTGFKVERLVMRELTEKPALASDRPTDIDFVDGWRLQRDMAPGTLQRTGNPLDAAIEGEGFFTVQTPAGEAYTRDGAFSLDANGALMTHEGFPVIGDGGPITLDPTLGEVKIGADGSILQGDDSVGQLRIVAFDTPAGLNRVGENLWRATDEAPRAPVGARVVGGMLESSNVNAVYEMTQMIEISQAYQSVSRLISQSDELRSQSISSLAGNR